MTPAAETAFDALGDPTRRAMIGLLAKGPRTVSSLADPLGVTRTAIGQHLRVLQAAGLVASEKRGRTRHCEIVPQGLVAIEAWARACRREWEARLDRLGTVLDRLERPDG